LNPLFVIEYRPAEFVEGAPTVGVGIVSVVPETVVMFVRHSVGARMRKLAVGMISMLPTVSTVIPPTDVTPADGPAA
jgi:hypothetical protein